MRVLPIPDDSNIRDLCLMRTKILYFSSNTSAHGVYPLVNFYPGNWNFPLRSPGGGNHNTNDTAPSEAAALKYAKIILLGFVRRKTISKMHMLSQF